MANFSPSGFSTGFARGAGVASQVKNDRLREMELRAAKQQQAQERLQKALETSEGNADDYFENIIEQISEQAAAGATEDQLAALGDAALMGPESHAMFLAQMRAQARVSGASDEELELLPSPGEYMLAKRRAVEMAIATGSFVASQDIGQTQTREGEDFVLRRTLRGVADMTEQGVLARSKIAQRQQIEQGPPGSFDQRTPSQLGAATQESIETLENAQAAIINLVQTGATLRETPRVAGVTGAANEFLGGIVGQVSPVMAQGMSQMLTGTDPERASQLRANFRIIIAENLSRITGEESGRFTEPERQIAEQTVRAIPLNATADQILGAFGTLLQLELASESRELARQGKPQRFDLLSAKEGEESAEIFGLKVSPTALDELDRFLLSGGLMSADVRDSVAMYLIQTQASDITPLRREDGSQ